ncbi:hypothetical protein L1887_33424 [Cichorium endivia]|nr:hypothetical protein L1887_33424 [Cichorium endivia]
MSIRSKYFESVSSFLGIVIPVFEPTFLEAFGSRNVLLEAMYSIKRYFHSDSFKFHQNRNKYEFIEFVFIEKFRLKFGLKFKIKQSMAPASMPDSVVRTVSSTREFPICAQS